MSIDTASLEIRALIYKLVSVGFLYPDEEWQKRMSGLIREFYQMENHSHTLDFENNITGINKILLSFSVDKKVLEELQAEHFRLFGPDPLCPLEISHWTKGSNIFMQPRQMAEMAGFYKAFGLDMSENLEVDNLSVAFEFLSYLCLKLLNALNKCDDDNAEITEKAIDSFRIEFVLPGLKNFVESIKTNSKTGFYKELGELAQK